MAPQSSRKPSGPDASDDAFHELHAALETIATTPKASVNRSIANEKHSGRRGDPVSLHPLSPDEAMKAVLAISPADVKRILAKRPGKNGRKS